MSKKVGIIGATGYAGAELCRLLVNHDGVEIAAVSSVSYEGKRFCDVYRNFDGILDMVLVDEDTAIEKSDIVFASLPHGYSEKIAAKCAEKDVVFIDLGADFRLIDGEDYKEWYGLDFEDIDLHKKAVYGLCELFRDEIKNAKLIANPGCYPTASALGLAPLLKNDFIETNSIIIDAKSGVTGAGRSPSATTHFPECNESLSAYKVAEHRHTPEIEQTLSIVGDCDVNITFVPHLLPINRGILSTMYAKIKDGVTPEIIQNAYEKLYNEEFFVRLLPNGETACIKNVTGSNFCDISLHFDARCGRVIVVSAIDNMIKGAAGQAIQNMNIMLGYDERRGLRSVPASI